MINLTLTKETFANFEKNSVAIAKNESLIIKVDTFYNLENAIITIRNGEIVKSIKFSQEFEIPKELLFAGYITAVVDLFTDGVKVKTWQIAPLKIIEADNNIVIENWMQDIETRLKALEDKHKIIL